MSKKKLLSKQQLSEDKPWYRLSRIIKGFILSFVVLVAFGIASGEMPKDVVDDNNTYFVCENNLKKKVLLSKLGISTSSYKDSLYQSESEEIKEYCGSDFKWYQNMKVEGSVFKAIGVWALSIVVGYIAVEIVDRLFFYLVLGYQPKNETEFFVL